MRAAVPILHSGRGGRTGAARAALAAAREGHEQLGVVALHTRRIEAARGPELRIDVHDEPAPGVRQLLHQEQRELARELDQPVVSCLRHDQHGVDVRVHARAACRVKLRLATVSAEASWEVGDDREAKLEGTSGSGLHGFEVEVDTPTPCLEFVRREASAVGIQRTN